MKRLAALCVSVWLGAQIGFGYVVAPILFANLDKQLAGQVAGQLFHLSNYAGLLAWGLTWLAMRRQSGWSQSGLRTWTRRWLLILLCLFAISEWAITPTIAALKAGDLSLLASWLGGSFKVWHGVSSMFHLAQSIIGIGLMVKLLRLSP